MSVCWIQLLASFLWPPAVGVRACGGVREGSDERLPPTSSLMKAERVRLSEGLADGGHLPNRLSEVRFVLTKCTI